jgi:hypothetical protein
LDFVAMLRNLCGGEKMKGQIVKMFGTLNLDGGGKPEGTTFYITGSYYLFPPMADEQELHNTVQQASTSLLKYIQKQAQKNSSNKSSLFDQGDVLAAETVQLIVGLKKIPEQGRAKPITLPIPHSLYKAEAGASICMFVKDNSEELKQKLIADPVDGLARVISLSALRRNYKEYKDRRKLVASHDLFLADDRITPMLTKA